MSIFSNYIRNFDWTYLLTGAAALIAITFHELSHGFIAYKLGDPTAKRLGRLSLNPIRHIDIWGLLMLIVAGFGWAKPVPVNMQNFKHPKRGMALTALAGPASNLLLAFAALLLAALLWPFENTIVSYIVLFLFILANISIGLGIFNLLPIPPLDGSKMLFSLFPDRIYYNILKYERYGMILMIVILSTEIITPFLNAARSAVFYALWVLASAPVEWLYGLIR